MSIIIIIIIIIIVIIKQCERLLFFLPFCPDLQLTHIATFLLLHMTFPSISIFIFISCIRYIYKLQPTSPNNFPKTIRSGFGSTRCGWNGKSGTRAANGRVSRNAKSNCWSRLISFGRKTTRVKSGGNGDSKKSENSNANTGIATCRRNRPKTELWDDG